MNRRLSFVALFVALLLSDSSVAQQLATLTVTASDPTGALMAGVTVTLKSVETGAKRTAITEGNGLAVIANVPPGKYELTAEAQSFKTYVVPVQLAVGQVASLSIAMGISARQEVVDVQASAPGIDPEKSEVSQVIDTPKISELPISGRDFIDFVLLTPSVTVGKSTAVGAQSPFTETVLKLSFAGVRESHTTFFSLDGLDYTTSISGVQRVSPSLDWVQEFRVIASPYTAESGRSLGSIVNTVTKSGTNTFHGSGYEYFRNNKLNAKNLLSAPGLNTLRFNQFGATVGGPIRKDKNFFFTGYEGQRGAESPIYSEFILSTINPNPATCPVLPPPGIFNPGCTSINGTKQFFGLKPESLGSFLQVNDYDKFIVKANNALSDKTSLDLIYLFNDTRKGHVPGASPGIGLPSAFRNNPVRDQTVGGNLVHVFSPTMIANTLMQYGIRTFHLDPIGAGFEPAIQIPGLLAGGAFVGGARYYQEQRIQAVENLTKIHGNHTFRFGAEIEPLWTSMQVPLFSPGFAIFSPDAFFGAPPFGQPTALAFLFLEPRQFFGVQIPPRDTNFENSLFAGPSEDAFTKSTELTYTHTLWGLYWQDQWRARPNLTVAFGARYDVDVFPAAKDVKINSGRFHPTKYTNIQPRVSVAYAFNGGKGVVRAGFGIFTAPFVYSDMLVSWIGAAAFTYINQPLLPQFQNPTDGLIGLGASGPVGVVGPFAAGPAFANFVQTGAYPAPSALVQFPLGWAQRDFPNPYSEQASLEIEHQLGHDMFVSVGYQFLHALKLPVYILVTSLPAGFLPDGKQNFKPADPGFGFGAAVFPIGFSIYHAGTLSLRKPFAHHYNVLANYTYSKSIDIQTTPNFENGPQDFLHPEYDRSVGDNDMRHRFTLAMLGETPNEWPRLLRGFKGSFLVALQSPRHYSILTGFDANNDNFSGNDRVGNIGRNTYKGASYASIDVRVQRGFPITARLKAEASFECFNLFNRVNVEDINHTYGAPDFVGPIPREFGDGITGPIPSFGTPKFVGPPRQLQLSFRLTF